MEDKIIANNRHAFHDYSILESLEAGIQLNGTEVKSARSGQVSLRDSFAKIENGEIFAYNMHIAPYEFGNIANTEPTRPRKLLLHKKQISKLAGELSGTGLTLIPLKLYFKNGIIKLEIGVARGKKIYDKREAIKRREMDRELRRVKKAG